MRVRCALQEMNSCRCRFIGINGLAFDTTDPGEFPEEIHRTDSDEEEAQIAHHLQSNRPANASPNGVPLSEKLFVVSNAASGMPGEYYSVYIIHNDRVHTTNSLVNFDDLSKNQFLQFLKRSPKSEMPL